jgi:hypothetical protein
LPSPFVEGAAGEENLELTPREIFFSKDQSLDPFPGGERFNYFRDVGEGNPAIKEMVWFNENTDSTRALIQAARRAGTRSEPGQATRFQLFLQRSSDNLRPARCAGTFRILVRPPVRADKKIALTQRHGAGDAGERKLLRVSVRPASRGARGGGALFARPSRVCARTKEGGDDGQDNDGEN